MLNFAGSGSVRLQKKVKNVQTTKWFKLGAALSGSDEWSLGSLHFTPDLEALITWTWTPHFRQHPRVSYVLNSYPAVEARCIASCGRCRRSSKYVPHALHPTLSQQCTAQVKEQQALIFAMLNIPAYAGSQSSPSWEFKGCFEFKPDGNSNGVGDVELQDL